MKGIKFILVIIVGLLLLVACEDGATIKITNQTNHNVYAEIDGIEVVIEGQESKSVSLETDERVIFFSDGKTKKTLKIEGETYRIWDAYNEIFPTETEIKVTPGKTYRVFCSPTDASVKVINNSEYPITSLRYRVNKQFVTSEWFYITYDPPLVSGDFAYYHLAPQTEQNRIYYNFMVESEGEIIYSIGDEFQGVELLMDQQHLIEIHD